MKWVYKSIRAVLVLTIIMAAVVPAALYVALSMPSVQRAVKTRSEKELTKALGMRVTIDDISFAPFNRLTLRRVAITDSEGDTAISVSRLGAGISLSRLFFTRETVLTYAEVIGLKADIRCDSAGAPLNIQPLIEALSPKRDKKEKRGFALRVNTVVVRKSSISFNVGGQPEDTLKFNPHHIAISNLRADLQIPAISDGLTELKLLRFAFEEQSGFELTNMRGSIRIKDKALKLKGFDIQLPRSDIRIDSLVLSESSKSLVMDEDSYFNPADLRAFYPALDRVDYRFGLEINVHGDSQNLNITNIDITGEESVNLWIRGEGSVSNLTDRERLAFDFPRIGFGCGGEDVATIVSEMSSVPDVALTVLGNLGDIDFLGEMEGDARRGHFSATAITAAGAITASLGYVPEQSGRGFSLSVNLDEMAGDVLFEGTGAPLSQIGMFSAAASVEGVRSKGINVMEGELIISSLEYKGVDYSDIALSGKMNNNHFESSVISNNPGLIAEIEAQAELSPGPKSLQARFSVAEFSSGLMPNPGRLEGAVLKGNGELGAEWADLDDLCGTANLTNLRLEKPEEEPVEFGDVKIKAEKDSVKRFISLTSRLADIEVSGDFKIASTKKSIQSIAGRLLPAVFPKRPERTSDFASEDSLTIVARLKSSAAVERIFPMPVKVIYPVEIYGNYIGASRELNLSVDAPYLQQGNRLLENTLITALFTEDSLRGARGDLFLSTLYPTKKGDMTMSIHSGAAHDCVDTQMDWKVMRDRDFSGSLSVTTFFERDSARHDLISRFHINPSTLVFNDTAWSVSPAKIEVLPGEVIVDNFRVGRNNEYLTASGRASGSAEDSVIVSLRNVNLDYVFETLDIPTAMFGGLASGDIHASALFSQEPVLYTDSLSVKRMSYNHSLIGDALIKSRWDVPSKAVEILADISQPNGGVSYVDGRIMPLSDSLDFVFDADRLEVGFMRPFMEAFTSSVSGYASGRARLWGSFKYIDMVGDIYAQDVKIKLDFTNTSYLATDTVRLTPGHIALDNITIRDEAGHTGRLNGWISHEFFKQPRFRFAITDAKSMLVYNVRENNEHPWSGRIYGNGGATITGEPGKVDINVNMSTAPNSTFNFVLTDAENASDYNFIVFRDREQHIKDSIAAATNPPAIVQDLKKRIAGESEEGSPSVYTMNFAVGVNPNTQVTLVMDPVGGDRIRAFGNGNIRMSYDSGSEDLKIFGTYTLERGSYNFTLQDIIIKDFTIRDGSSISFHGDPYAAQLDIQAVYSVNANLSDLDESFLEDRELNRTNVPVHALLNVTGDMRQPDISFDLEFPTLSQDTYRKVRSIVSTEDMMNRQIIYLLALSRFYTPDYMNATKGNEFVSVASSTISSQLGSILGQLSDTWSVAPQFRSDRGDFSDVEVDLALRSNLLNNRLLLNGNFGYRDKALNSNAFIGDFDIEYLLNRSGNVRLKAYNRYNDRNFYVKSATTTQGVGIVFKRDFDNFFSFWRKLRRDHKAKREATDSTETVKRQ